MTLDQNTETLRHIIKRIGDNIPIIGLTATATPKVQEDILKEFRYSQKQQHLRRLLIDLICIMKYVRKPKTLMLILFVL